MTGEPVALLTETAIESFAHAFPAGHAHRNARTIVAITVLVLALTEFRDDIPFVSIVRDPPDPRRGHSTRPHVSGASTTPLSLLRAMPCKLSGIERMLKTFRGDR